jgi:hypothetical protein
MRYPKVSTALVGIRITLPPVRDDLSSDVRRVKLTAGNIRKLDRSFHTTELCLIIARYELTQTFEEAQPRTGESTRRHRRGQG